MLSRRIAFAALAVATLLCAAGPTAPARAKAARAEAASRAEPAPRADYVPGQIVVGYLPPAAIAHTARSLGATAGASELESTRIVKVSRGRSIWPAIARLRRQRGVLYAVPNYIAHQAGSWIPNDPGNSHQRRGWRKLQWNFLAGTGIDAPGAWANMFRVHRAGGRGVTIAVLDTGVAYRDWDRFRQAPDFTNTKFVDPYDFVAKNPFPLDREGHGTFVTGMIAESTNNDFGLTGLAYGATIMPVRVLDADGNGDSVTIGKGIRYAVTHGARVINLSLEFRKDVTASDIPEVISAIGFAHRHGVVVVAASGNDSSTSVAYPAAARSVISVGATTRDRCLADYSNGGARLDLVAPGGGDDASLSDDPDCHPFRTLPPVRQMTFQDLNSLTPGANATRFGFPGTYGTSMAAPAVSATAALVIASGVIGSRPSPDQVLDRLEQTATPLGSAARPNDEFGWGLVNAAAATAPGPPQPQ
jgi:serine protease